MEINFDRLNFKLEPLTSRPVNDYSQTDRHQNFSPKNPFKKTERLFKHISKETSKNQSINDSSTLPKFNEAHQYLQNFDSFQNKSIKIQPQSKGHSNPPSQSNFLSFKPTQNQQCNPTIIRIQDNQPNIEDYSIIMDDINSTLKIEDILQDSKNNYQSNRNYRSKTQPCHNIQQDQPIQNLQYKFDMIQKQSPTKQFPQQKQSQQITIKQCDKFNKKKRNGFFLTQQSQTISQQIQNVKEYYLDLRDQTKLFSSNNETNLKPLTHETLDLEGQSMTICSTRTSLKKLIKNKLYHLVDEIEIMNESDIDPQFVNKLQECMKGLKKIDLVPKKWNKPSKNQTVFLKKQNLIPNKHPQTVQNTIDNKVSPVKSITKHEAPISHIKNRINFSANTTTKKWKKPTKALSPNKNISNHSTLNKTKPFK